MDKRQVAIIFQNALGHSVNVIKYNSAGKVIKLDDVLVAAEIITKKVLEVSKKLG